MKKYEFHEFANKFRLMNKEEYRSVKLILKETIDKEFIIRTGACHSCNVDFCNNDYANCIIIKKAREQKEMGKWL